MGRYYYTGWRPNFHIDFGPVRKMFGFSVKLLVTNIINTVSNNVLTFVFGRFYPINDVVAIRRYNWDTKANSFVANTVGQIAQPVLASIQNDKNRELLVFRKMLRFTAFLSFSIDVCVEVARKKRISATLEKTCRKIGRRKIQQNTLVRHEEIRAKEASRTPRPKIEELKSSF